MAKPEIIKEIIKELNPQAIFVNGFEKAIHGTGKVIGGETVAVYNADDCLQILIDEHDMGELEAWEHFNDTVIGGSPSPHKPIFISDWRLAVDPEQVLKDIRLDKQKTLDEIINEIEEKDDEEDNEDE